MLSWMHFLGLRKRTRKFQSGRGLRIESLEGRQLLAGDVGVELLATGDLMVTGDENANDIVVASGDNGILVLGNEGTNIVFDGVTAEFAEIELPEGMETIRDLKLDMLAGDDRVLLEDVTVGRSLKTLLREGDDWMGVENSTIYRHGSISNGPGTDFVAIESVTVEERLAINAGEGAFELDAYDMELARLNINAAEGSDTLNVRSSQISGDFAVVNTGGDDDVTVYGTEIEGNFTANGGDALDNIYLGDSSVDGDATFETGYGDGNVTVYASSVSGNLTVTNGGGNNSTYIGFYSSVNGDVNITSSEGSDSVQIKYYAYIEGDVNISTGSGDDSVEIDDLNAYSYYGNDWYIDTAEGDDWLTLSDIDADSLEVHTGEGQDQVDMDYVDAYGVSIFTSAGDDFVTVEEVEAETLWVDLGTANLVPQDQGFNEFAPVQGEYLHVGYTSIDEWTSIRGSVGSRSIDVSDSSLGELEIRTSAGEDYIHLYDVYADDATIRTGSSHDELWLEGESLFSELVVFFGSGNDQLQASDFTFGNPTRLHGGSGSDEAYFAAEFFDYTPIVEAFEYESYFNEPSA